MEQMELLTKSSQTFRKVTYWLLLLTVTTLNYQVSLLKDYTIKQIQFMKMNSLVTEK